MCDIITMQSLGAELEHVGQGWHAWKLDKFLWRAILIGLNGCKVCIWYLVHLYKSLGLSESLQKVCLRLLEEWKKQPSALADSKVCEYAVLKPLSF